jgi:DNA-binding transcriptional regulator YhcF (GntR family)
MVILGTDAIIDAAIRILLIDEQISLTFSDNSVSIKFPTTRRLAEFLEVPHYYILPYFAMMEQDALVTRAERVGVLTTMKGTKRLIARAQEAYLPQMEALIGPALLSAVIERIRELTGKE